MYICIYVCIYGRSCVRIVYARLCVYAYAWLYVWFVRSARKKFRQDTLHALHLGLSLVYYWRFQCDWGSHRSSAPHLSLKDDSPFLTFSATRMCGGGCNLFPPLGLLRITSLCVFVYTNEWISLKCVIVCTVEYVIVWSSIIVQMIVPTIYTCIIDWRMGHEYTSFLDVCLFPRNAYSYSQPKVRMCELSIHRLSWTFYVFFLVWHSTHHLPARAIIKEKYIKRVILNPIFSGFFVFF